jgi:hypothetical protein
VPHETQPHFQPMRNGRSSWDTPASLARPWLSAWKSNLEALTGKSLIPTANTYGGVRNFHEREKVNSCSPFRPFWAPKANYRLSNPFGITRNSVLNDLFLGLPVE